MSRVNRHGTWNPHQRQHNFISHTKFDQFDLTRPGCTTRILSCDVCNYSSEKGKCVTPVFFDCFDQCNINEEYDCSYDVQSNVIAFVKKNGLPRIV